MTLPRVLIPETDLKRRVRELAGEIARDSPSDQPIYLICVLKGAFMFLADLMRELEGPVTCDFLAVSSYGTGQRSSGEVQLTKDLDQPLDGRHVVLVEDIVDTGRTLLYLQDLLRARNPRSLRTVCLLDKRPRREVDVVVDYLGFVIEDQFVVGYGLDLNQEHRNLRYVGIL